jgi:hypothetical protein
MKQYYNIYLDKPGCGGWAAVVVLRVCCCKKKSTRLFHVKAHI